MPSKAKDDWLLFHRNFKFRIEKHVQVKNMHSEGEKCYIFKLHLGKDSFLNETITERKKKKTKTGLSQDNLTLHLSLWRVKYTKVTASVWLTCS